jgi:hypothetical protein
MLRRVLDHDNMNKFSQLSVSVSFTLWATCLGSVPIYVTQGFHIVNRECFPCSPVSIVSRNRSGVAKPQCGQSGLRFSAAISARQRWVIVSMYDLSSM